LETESSRPESAQAAAETRWNDEGTGPNSITSFGEDAQGELYVTIQSGIVFKIVTN